MAWLPKKTVIVPVDFSGKSVSAVATALELVEQPSAVHVIHVVVPLNNMSPGLDWGSIDDQSREQATREHFNEFLEQHGFVGATTVVRVGDPGLEVADYAKESAADLIVISSHGYQGLTRLLLGSVAERVIQHAPCPVLILRRDDE